MRNQLEIQTLGGLFITLGGQPIHGFDSKKVAALLVYLACTERTYPREVLAEFFWEGRTQSQALSNLRVMINSLRRTVEPYIVITRQSVSMNFDSGYMLDVNAFSHRLDVAKRLIAERGYISVESAEELEAAFGLYVGDFLEGFYVDSPAFESWVVRTREGLKGDILDTLDQLINYTLGAQDYRAGLEYARRMEEMDSYNETAHRHLMLLYAMMGQRHTAIEQYEKCCQLLGDELDVEPSAETVKLYEQIRADELDRLTPAIMATTEPKSERYQMLQLVGRGSMGEVYQGIDTYTQKTVAIKVLQTAYVKANPDAVARFVREGEMLEELNHPNIVKVLDVLQESDMYWIITEYVEGGTLADVLRREKRLSIERILEIALDLSDALTRAHRLQIIHRDIKPTNILIAEDGKALLADFGLARIGESGITEAGSVVGTVEYLSPEALAGEQIDTRADIWSFGVTLYEMLTGERPFGGQTISEIMAAVVNQPTPDLEALCPAAPIAFIDLIYRMLDKNQQTRIRSVRQVGLELEAILAAEDLHIVRTVEPQLEGISRVTQSSFAIPMHLVQSRDHNLPETLTPLVGREAELKVIKDLLNDPSIRLVTIVGAGGVGKTRLSITAARGQLETFDNGVFFVSLSSLQSSEYIVPAIAEALQFEFYEGEDAQEQVLNYLRDKAILLVMDNFEHVLDGAYLVSKILQAAPFVKVLVTSQEKLNLQGEMVLPITGIAFPQSNIEGSDISTYPAVELFVQSARRVAHHLEIEGDDWWYVNRICQLVDGLPLGIVLAAAWVEMLSIEEIAAEIERSLDFLETTMGDVPLRQRSVRAVFDYAWELMRKDEQAVFMKMSVFRGGFTRRAVQAIIPDASLKILMGLVNKSLLYRDPDSGRYDMHGSSHQFADEKLRMLPNEYEQIWEAHCQYFADYVGKQESLIRAGLQNDALQEMENIRQSWTHAVDHQHIALIRLFLESLSWLYEVQGWYQEGLDQFSYAVEVLGQGDRHEHQVIYGWLVGIKGWFMARCGDRDQGRELLKDSIRQLRDLDAREELALTLRFLARIVDKDEDLLEVMEALEAAIAYLSPENPSRIQSMHIILADIYKQMGDIERANEHAKEGEAINRELINPRGNAEKDRVIGDVEAAKGNFNEAKKRFQDSLATYQELGYRQGMVFSLKGLAKIAEKEGNGEQAIRCYLEALETAMELSLQPSVAELLIALIPLQFAPQGVEKIVGVLAYVSADLKANIESKNAIQAYLDDCRDELSDEAFEQAYQQGRQLSLDEIIDDVRARL